MEPSALHASPRPRPAFCTSRSKLGNERCWPAGRERQGAPAAAQYEQQQRPCARGIHRAKETVVDMNGRPRPKAGKRAPAGRPAGSGSAPPGPACCVPNGAADKRVFSAFRKQRNGPISLFLKETAICTGASKFYMNLRTFSGKSQKAEVPAEYACCWDVVVMMACLPGGGGGQHRVHAVLQAASSFLPPAAPRSLDGLSPTTAASRGRAWA